MDANETLKTIIDCLFFGVGDYYDVLESIESLAGWLANGGFAPKPTCCWEYEEILAGAYWHCVHTAIGQTSDEYRLQCIIGKMYKPSPLATGPESGPEQQVYNAMDSLSKSPVK